jgi:hypothetical protein
VNPKCFLEVSNLDCLIIQQPYASLIAFGRKRWEFRSYDCRKRGSIGIAASPSLPLRTLSPEINRVSGSFPSGAVLATADITNSFFVTHEDLKEKLTDNILIVLHGHQISTLNEPLGEPRADVERAIASSRWESYAWQIENVKPLAVPLPFIRSSRSTWVEIEIPQNSDRL